MILKSKLSNKIKLFCFGFGLTAKYLVNLLSSEQIKFSIAGTSRLAKRDENIFYFNDNNFDKEILEYLKNSTHILISTPPKTEDSIIKNFSAVILQNKNLVWLGYLSSTSVYGDHQGKWVTETSETKPNSEAGKKRLSAEHKFLNANLPVRIFRLSGIYSVERNIFQKLKDSNYKMINSNNQIFSRIHVEDIAQVLLHSFQESKPRDIFNVSDDYPCAYKEVVQYACDLLNFEMPKQISLTDVPDGILKDFYRDSKQVSNHKIKSLGIKLKYPTFKEGLKNILDQFR